MNRIKSVNRVFLATVFISILGSFLNRWINGYTNNYFIMLLMAQVLLVIPSLAYIIVNKLNVAKVIRFNKIKISNVILIIIFTYLITPLLNFINAISMLFVQNDTTDIMNNIIQNNNLFLCLLMVAIVPCVFEESVYRGVIYNEYSKVNPLKGILLSGFLFGIIHGNLNQFSYAFVMGMIFALLIEATNSILATMIVHSIINGTSILIMALYPKVLELLESIYGSDHYNAKELIDTVNSGISVNLDITYIVQNYGLTAVIGTILAFIVFKAIAKNTGRWEYIKGIFRRNPIKEISTDITMNEMPLMRKQHLLTYGLVVAIVICVALMILNEFYTSEITDQPLKETTTLIIGFWIH